MAIGYGYRARVNRAQKLATLPEGIVNTDDFTAIADDAEMTRYEFHAWENQLDRLTNTTIPKHDYLEGASHG